MAIAYLELHLSLEQHQYAVIDRIRVPTLPENWPRLELVSPMLAPQAHLYPWLLPLHELPAGEWRKLMAELSQPAALNTPPVCPLLLSSTHSLQAMRNILVGALHFTDEHHNGHILRYYDPRVLFHMHWMLTPGQLFNQLSAKEIPYWTFWLDGHWHTLEFPERPVLQPGETMQISLDQLQRCGQINQVLAKLPRAADKLLRQEISRRIDVLLEQAMHCQLPTQEDRVAFALHGLRQREAFWTAPKMAELLAKARVTPDLYRDETNIWTDAKWLEMTSKLSSDITWKY